MGAEPTKQKHMMHRSDFKKVVKLNAEVMKLREENDELIETMCDENADANWWPDKVNVKGGFVLVESPDTPAVDGVSVEGADAMIAVKAGAAPCVERRRITSEWRKTLKAKRTEILGALHRLERKVTLIAVACGVPTTCIDIGSGEITVKVCDVHEFPKAGESDEFDESGRDDTETG